MKRIIFILAFILGLISANAQTWQKVAGYWEYKFLRVDGTLGTFTPPLDTIPGAPAGSIAVKNNVLYIKQLAGSWSMGAALTLQQITHNGNKTTDTIISAGIRTKNILGDTLSEPDFEIDLVPDIQNMLEFYPTSVLYPMFHFWRDSTAAYNIKAVIQLGDLTNNGQADQMAAADSAIRNIDIANIPYMCVIGNHDYNNNPRPMIRNASVFNTFFGPSRFAGKSWYGGNYLGSHENYYIKFDVGKHKFLVLGLEFLPRDSALNWAQSVLDSFPDRETIIATHAYRTFFTEKSVDTSLFSTNYYSLTTTNSNNGQAIWDKLIKKNKQIIMVTNGHYIYPYGTTAMTNRMTETGINGNTVYQIMIDYQNDNNGGDGYFTRLKFRPSAGKIDVSTYSSTLKINDPRFPGYSLDYPAINISAAVGINGVNGSLNIAGETHIDSTLYLHNLSRERLLITRQNGKVDTLTDQLPNTFLAGPASGSAANPSFRVLTSTDIPKIVANGLYLNGDTIEFGQPIGTLFDPAKFKSNREIPLNGYNIGFNGTGNLGVGTNTPLLRGDFRNNLGVTASGYSNYQTSLQGGLPATMYTVSGAGNYGLAIERASADGGNGWLTFYKSRNADPTVKAAAQQFDGIGTINWQTVAGNNSTVVSILSIRGRSDTVTSTYAGGEMLFSTTNNSGVTSERMRLTSGGNLEISTNPGSNLSGYNHRLWVNGTVGIHKDSLQLLSSVTSQSLLVIDTVDNRVKRIDVNGIKGYKIYTSLLSQSGTSDPTASVLGNNNIGSIAWTRSGIGAYVGTLSGAFPSGKVFILVGQNADGITANAFRIDNNTVTLKTYVTATGGSTDVFSDLSIEVRVYP